MVSVYWLIGFVFLVIIEAATMALTTIWFAGGALVAAIAAGIGMVTRTNADSLIGSEVRVTEEINNQKGTGTVLAGGQEWTARSQDEETCYPPDTMVVVQSIQGVKLIVSRHKEEM